MSCCKSFHSSSNCIQLGMIGRHRRSSGCRGAEIVGDSADIASLTTSASRAGWSAVARLVAHGDVAGVSARCAIGTATELVGTESLS